VGALVGQARRKGQDEGDAVRLADAARERDAVEEVDAESLVAEVEQRLAALVGARELLPPRRRLVVQDARRIPGEKADRKGQ